MPFIIYFLHLRPRNYYSNSDSYFCFLTFLPSATLLFHTHTLSLIVYLFKMQKVFSIHITCFGKHFIKGCAGNNNNKNNNSNIKLLTIFLQLLFMILVLLSWLHASKIFVLAFCCLKACLRSRPLWKPIKNIIVTSWYLLSLLLVSFIHSFS